jgi:hypothetical protein
MRVELASNLAAGDDAQAQLFLNPVQYSLPLVLLLLQRGSLVGHHYAVQRLDVFLHKPVTITSSF